MYGYRQGFPYTKSSGGSALWDSVTQQYIMVVTEYSAECPNPAHNSAIALATSDNVEGPYIKQFRIFGTTSSEPMLARMRDGYWGLYFTSKRRATTGKPAIGIDPDNVHGTLCTRSSYMAKCSCPGVHPLEVPHYPTWLARTKTPLNYASWHEVPPYIVTDGMWVYTDQNCVNGQDPAGYSQARRAISTHANFHAVANGDESLIGLWRTWECTSHLCAENRYSELGTAEGDPWRCFSVLHPVTGTDWSEPQTYRYPLTDSTQWRSSTDPSLNSKSFGSLLPFAKKKLRWLFGEMYSSNQTANGLEDPTVYKDSNGRYHALMRESFDSCDGAGCVGPRANIGHAWSVDGLHL